MGATLQGEDQILPSFIHVLGGDHKESDGYETSADDDEIKPLIEGKQQIAAAYPETEIVEVQSSYNDVDGNEIPTVVIEPDFSDENHDTDEDHYIKSDISGEMCDTAICYKNYNTESCDASESTVTKNHDAPTNCHINQDSLPAISELSPAMDHPLSQAKSTSLLSVKSNSADEEEDLLASWINLKPVGLYNESVDEENVVMVVADATCARVSFFLYPMLVLCRLLSQLVLVPLLLFQILDTYAWICISGDIYCSSILNQYRLGLDKAALAFTFYCCLLASILATAILRWFPCSKYARKAGATCIM